MEQNNLYDTLGVDKDATAEEIKKAFKKKATENHPDKNKNENAGDKMADINNAYAVLGDPGRKAKYDTTGSTENASFDQKMSGFVTEVFMNIIDSCNIREDDLIKKFKEQVKNIIYQNRVDITAKKRFIKKYTDVLNRLKSKEPGAIHKVLNLHITNAKNGIEMFKINIEFLEKAYEAIDYYEYEYDDKTKKPIGFLEVKFNDEGRIDFNIGKKERTNPWA